MTKTLKNTQEIVAELTELIGTITAKNLFSGYGLFKQDLMFGLYQQGIFYIRAENKLARYLESLGALSYLAVTPNPQLSISNYYQLPCEIRNNKKHYKYILLLSLAQVRTKKTAETLAKQKRIKDLPNLSIKHERLLSKINITDVKSFKLKGSVNCYIELKQQGIPVNLALFWNFTAALLYKNVHVLTKSEKEYALKKLNKGLKNAGLKAVKLMFVKDI
ncbi:DNA transformation protein [Canicola haemoglobinophilus]|uniref:DNA transformation protein n=1 Tax=Canicola haemoglobinophilus TaxID=733 RepID=A0AB38HAH0_9PAST|nr:TfoX/Sxy family DNA transformation protein [Canicola haemoglobinophilus]STO55171.1 DNA transformation protein [Canicola haemoglobinophilus]STO69258.1 DNA transformation protein [Canicola haemoglobinophilus]